MKIVPIRVWRVFYSLFAKWLPVSYKSHIAKCLRCFLGRRIIKSMGKGCNIERGAEFSSDLVIGDNSGIGIKCEIAGPTIIGKDVMMGPEVLIYTTNHEHSRVDIPMRMQGITEPMQVTIEDDVWIGRRAIILGGVNVGQGSIIAAGAVVSKSVPPFSVVAGNPARIVKIRK